MEIRKAELKDFDRLVELSKEHNYPFPDFKSILTILVAEEDGKVVAYGYTQRFVEVVFLPDTGSKQDIVKSLKGLTEGMIESLSPDIKQVHAFVMNDSFGDILTKKFGYEPCSGKALVLNING
jgi:hypothetical protein